MKKLECSEIAIAFLGGTAKRSGSELVYHCPNHDDHHPSLKINTQKNCFLCGPCDASGNAWKFAAFLSHADPNDKKAVTTWLRERGVLEDCPHSQPGPRNPETKIVAVYPYTDKAGVFLFEKVRLEPKSFYIRHPDGQGGFTHGLGDTQRVLYRLPAVLAASEVIITEGEKDADTGRALGACCTSNPFGAGEWNPSYTESLRNKGVAIIPDNDHAGKKHSETVAAALRGIARSVKIVTLPYGEDLTDWTQKGGTHADLKSLIAQATQWDHLESPAPAVEVSEPAEPQTPSPSKSPALPEAAWYGLSKEYRDIVGPQTEASDHYHLTSFLVAVGACLGRTVHTRIAGTLFPNLFVVLVGPSGGARKGTAMDHAIRLAQALNTAIGILPALDSSEGFIDHLEKVRERQGGGDNVSAIVELQELRSLIDKSGMQGLRNIVPTLTKAYDCPKTLDIMTRNRPVSVPGPTVSLLAGTTMRWLEKVKPEDLEGGLGNRVMWIPGEPKEAIPKAPPLNQHQWNKLVQELAGDINFWKERRSTLLDFSSDADRRWQPIYRELYSHRNDEELISVLTERLQNHCVKTALIYAALDRSPVIEMDHLEAAYALTNFLYNGLWMLFRGFGMSPTAQLEQKIIAVVQKAGQRGIRQREIKRRFWREDAERLNRCLYALTLADGPLEDLRDGKKIILRYRTD